MLELRMTVNDCAGDSVTHRTLPEFVAEMVERLAPLGPVRARSMFGGWGLSIDGLTFALVADGLYLKADAVSRGRFEEAGLAPFRPFADRPTTMSYYPMPDAALDDPAEFRDWAREGWEAALRAAARKRR
jgi:DNA transformation protein